jgi:hypothetical protein
MRRLALALGALLLLTGYYTSTIKAAPPRRPNRNVRGLLTG